MPPALPVLKGRDAVQIFMALGWQVVRQNGSHIIMVKPGGTVTLSIPDHKEVAKGTLRSLIRAAGLTTAEFLQAAQIF